jgi:hypothetical protein
VFLLPLFLVWGRRPPRGPIDASVELDQLEPLAVAFQLRGAECSGGTERRSRARVAHA